MDVSIQTRYQRRYCPLGVSHGDRNDCLNTANKFRGLINDLAQCERAEIIWEKGTDRGRFFRGQVDRYTWVDIGSSYIPADILAAYLFGQLEASEHIQATRERIWQYYCTNLADWASERDVRLPCVPPHCEPPGHLFYMLLPSLAQRQALIAHLKERGIGSAFHYQALNTSSMGQRFGGKPGDCPVAEQAADCLLRLPFHGGLIEEAQAAVVEAVKEAQLT